MGIFFLKAAILTLAGVVERPLAHIQERYTGKEGFCRNGGAPMELSWDEFQGQVAVLWNEVWGALRLSEKRSPRPVMARFQRSKIIYLSIFI